MGQTADINGLVGKKISYHDGFTGSLTAFTITAIKYDQDRHGYEVRGARAQDFFFFFSTNRMLILAARNELTYCSKIDGCAFEETFTIQG
jgi:hypothetical protein